MQQVNQGSTIELSLEIRSHTGLLADPTSTPTLIIKRPDDTTYMGPVVAVQIATGVYRFAVAIETNGVLGIWRAVWTATLEGSTVETDDPFEVVELDAELIPDADGLQSFQPGETATMLGEFRSPGLTNLLVDVPDAAVVVADPAGNPMTSVLEQLTSGLYLASIEIPLDAAPGVYTVTWTGTIDNVVGIAEDAFIVGAVGSLYPYGSSIDGVRKYLPDMVISGDSKPSTDQVGEFLNQIANQIAFRIGDYTTTISDAGLQGRVTVEARRLTELGAASYADDAAHPDVATVNGDYYGERLWKKFEEGLEQLVQVVNDATPGVDPGAGSNSGTPEVFSPPPAFTSSMAF